MERNISVFAIFINRGDAHNPINGGMKFQKMYLKAVVSPYPGLHSNSV